jgi:hypothetical protein
MSDVDLARDSRRAGKLRERLHTSVSTEERGTPALQVGDANVSDVCPRGHGGDIIGGCDGSQLDDVGSVSVRRWLGMPSFNENTRASSRQVGGDHYNQYAIQPSEYIIRNELGWLEGNAIKYITRHKDKGGAQDIDKAIHYLELLKEWTYGR